jgi:energy-coupling factor transporter ATP-binding protein EcfA2
MKNWLITADIHIDDYTQFNYEYRSRLNQFLKLADRYIELATIHNCDTIVLAGDTINRPTNRPYVWNVIDKFINKLKQNFCSIYYILGQHSVDSKSNNINKEDTVLTIYDDEKFIYMDHKILKMPSGKLIAFKDWTPVQDLSWIETPVDILIGHYTKSEMFGQDIDESKFKIMLHGDIHNSQEIGKFISIGTPLQKDMSSQQRGTCIILNPDTCEWKRIGTDDEHTRFLRIDYVRDPELDGFEGPLQYHIYKPRNAVNTTNIKSSLPEWSEIDELTEELVNEKGLSIVHSEVKSKNPVIKEIDFNFKLMKLKIHGYRSIEDLELNFTGNDRIVLVGNNGSGKSSLVRALKAVFENSRYINYEKSDFTDYLKVELDFLYQNKVYHLWKGSNDWGLEIDGNVVGYNNKTEFENDILIKLPFLSYLDLFFFSASVPDLSSQFTSDRRIQLLSKFYRLDRIESYNEIAISLRQDKYEELQKKKDELNRLSGVLDNILRRLSELSQYEGHTRDEYFEIVNELNNLRVKFDAHQQWDANKRILETKLQTHKNALESYRKRMTLNVGETNNEIEKSKTNQQKISDQIELLTKRANRLKELNNIMTQSLTRGKQLRAEYDSLISGVCPTCGSKVCNEHTKTRIEELTALLDGERKVYSDISQELSTYSEEEKVNNYYVSAILKLKAALKDWHDTELMYSTKITQYEIARSDYNNEQKLYDEVHKELTLHKAAEPKSVTLPLDFQEKLYSATSELSKFDEYLSEKKNRDDQELLIEALKDSMNKIQSYITKYDEYISLINRTGEIMKLILQRMAESFSDNTIKYEVESGVYRNKPYIKFNSYFKVKNSWRIYETLSSGQRTISDLDFLSKLFSVKTGLLVMDESLRHLDFNMAPIAWDTLSSMNVNTIIISTHDANFTNFTKKIMLELDAEGKTISTII